MNKKVKIVSVLLVLLLMTLAAMGSGSSGSSSSSSKKCAFKEGGKEVCNSSATSDSNFCSYHKKYLDDAYNSLIGK